MLAQIDRGESVTCPNCREEMRCVPYAERRGAFYVEYWGCQCGIYTRLEAGHRFKALGSLMLKEEQNA